MYITPAGVVLDKCGSIIKQNETVFEGYIRVEPSSCGKYWLDANGKAIQFDTALKYDSDKPRMELLDFEALEEVALVLNFGAKKYAENNWRKGFKYTRLIGACFRHLGAFLRGQDKDPETGLSHIAHAMCCLMFLLWMIKNKPEFDDRFSKQESQTQ